MVGWIFWRVNPVYSGSNWWYTRTQLFPCEIREHIWILRFSQCETPTSLDGEIPSFPSQPWKGWRWAAREPPCRSREASPTWHCDLTWQQRPGEWNFFDHPNGVSGTGEKWWEVHIINTIYIYHIIYTVSPFDIQYSLYSLRKICGGKYVCTSWSCFFLLVGCPMKIRQHPPETVERGGSMMWGAMSKVGHAKRKRTSRVLERKGLGSSME